MEDKKEIFIFNDRNYNFNVEFDEESKLLKLTIVDLETKEEKLVNISGLIPHGATPDCILINDLIGKDLINELEKQNILLDVNSIYAQVNFKELYKYDPKGVKEFLDYHTHQVEYENAGMTQDEVKKDIRKYTEKYLKKQDVKDKLDDIVWDSNTENYIFMYSLLNKKNPQDSVIAYCDDGGETIFLITPYQKGFDDKFEIVPDWQFNYYGGMMTFLQDGYEIIDIGEGTHYSIWQEVYDRLLEPKDERYKKGVEKYMKYCKKNNISKESIMKAFALEHFNENIMEFYKPKSRER